MFFDEIRGRFVGKSSCQPWYPVRAFARTGVETGWITEVKSDETRARRLATAVEWMAEGKIGNRKYVTKIAAVARQ
jgi:hypothetical protein